MRIFTSIQYISIDKPNISLMKMMSMLPNNIFHLMKFDKGIVTLKNLLIINKILICKDQNRALELLIEFLLRQREEPRIKQDYVGNFLLNLLLKSVIGLNQCSATIRVTHQNHLSFVYFKYCLIELSCSHLHLSLPKFSYFNRICKISVNSLSVLWCSYFIF